MREVGEKEEGGRYEEEEGGERGIRKGEQQKCHLNQACLYKQSMYKSHLMMMGSSPYRSLAKKT